MDDRSRNSGELIVVGANHRSSSMIFRDKVAIRNGQLGLFLERLNSAGISNALVTSNNDRTEIYVESISTIDSRAEIVKLLSAHSGISRRDVEAQTYSLIGRDAIRHLLSVYCRLDGLVIGDPRPAENLKNSLMASQKKQLTSGTIELVMAGAFKAAARVHSETKIGNHPISIPSAAVQVARDLHGDLSACTGLLVGAGEMGELLASSFLSAGVKTLIVTHFVPAKAENLGQILNCHVDGIELLPQLLCKSDIVFTSVNSRRLSLTAELVTKALKQRRRKPIFLIDTGVPGDIDKTIGDMEDAYLYSLDDLERVTRSKQVSREIEAEKAWTIINDETEKVIKALSDTVSDDQNIGAPFDTFEALRKEAVRAAKGDADKATQLLLDWLRKNHGLGFERNQLHNIEHD